MIEAEQSELIRPDMKLHYLSCLGAGCCLETFFLYFQTLIFQAGLQLICTFAERVRPMLGGSYFWSGVSILGALGDVNGA